MTLEHVSIRRRVDIRRRGAQALTLAAVLCLAGGPASAQSPPSRVLLEGEELIYNVRFGFFDLGQIRITTGKQGKIGDRVVYSTRAKIDSYKGVPFVDAHATFESIADAEFYSHGYVGRSKEGDSWTFARYTFDYDRKKALFELGTRDTIVSSRDSISVSGPVQDGLSLFFFARDRLYSGKSVNSTAIIRESPATTLIRYGNKRTSVEIDAVDYPIDVMYFDGTADFVGFYGLTGEFEGWFSNDEARVPIMAKMKVFIGSVTIELMKWSRPGWAPPKGAG